MTTMAVRNRFALLQHAHRHQGGIFLMVTSLASINLPKASPARSIFTFLASVSLHVWLFGILSADQ